MTRPQAAHLIVVCSAILLIGTALLHAVAGYPAISRALHGTNLQSPVVAVLQIIWLSPSMHWILAAALALVVTFSRTPNARLFLVLSALFPGFDGTAFLIRVGVFAGGVLLLASSVLLLAAALLYPERRERGHREVK